MAAIALVTAGRASLVENNVTYPGVAGAAITAGQVVRLDTATGKFVLANSDLAANARAFGVALRNAFNGQELTVLRCGIMDGFDFQAAALAYDADVFLGDATNTAGSLGTVTGTVSKIVGKVVPLMNQAFGAAYDKALYVNLL